MRTTQHLAPGVTLVETLLASALFGLLVTGLVSVLIYGQQVSVSTGLRQRAVAVAEEGLEAVRSMRNTAFSGLTDGVHGLSTSTNVWAFNGAQDTQDIYTRTVEIGAIDAQRKTVTSTVTWTQDGQRTGSVSLTTRLTNWLASVGGDWHLPIRVGGGDLSGTADGVKIQTQDAYAYVIRTTGNPTFAIFEVTDATNPILRSSLSSSIIPLPTNIFVAGNYAYISSQASSPALYIVDISNPLVPTIAGSFSITTPGNKSTALGIYVVGTTIYLGCNSDNKADEFFIINASNPASPTLMSSMAFSDSINEVAVSGNYAYLATSLNNDELTIVNITNPAAPVVASSLDLPGNTNALSIAVHDTFLSITQDFTLSFFSLATPASPTLLSTFNAGGIINDIALDIAANTFLFIATTNQNQEFQVVDIAIPASPSLAGFVNLTGNLVLNGVAYLSGMDRAFGVGTNNTEEFTAFAPQ
ncbi:MAG: hypothetical protein WCV84_01630 [Patescibacteria group bacterium]